MLCKILIVEDEPLIALNLEDAVLGLGHELIGIATNKSDALYLGAVAEVALVDVYLTDGPTGPTIGKELASKGVSVLFMTGNPENLGDGIAGTLGVIAKPVLGEEAEEAIRYAVDRYERRDANPPNRFVEFAASS